MTQTRSLLLGAIVLLALAWAWPGADLHTKAGLHLIAVMAWATAGTGALLLLAIAHLVGAQWGVSLHGPLRAVAASIPALALFFVPLLALWPVLDGFVQSPDTTISDTMQLWLGRLFFTGRAVLYWVTWAFAWWLWRTPRRPTRAAVFGAVGVSLTLSLATFDWVMALAAPWQSTILGVYVTAGSLIAGLSAATLFALVAGHLRGTPLSRAMVRTVARLLFTFCFFWGYLGICQVLIIHMADLPDEVVWYMQRAQGRYAPETAAVVLGQSFVPFAVFLFARMQRSRRMVGAMAAWCLAWHAVDVHWLVMPSVRGAAPHPFLSALAWASVGCVALACSLTAQKGNTP